MTYRKCAPFWPRPLAASLSRRRGARAVVAAQQALSDQVLEQCGTRGQFRDLFARLRDYPKFGLPVQHGEPGGVQRRALVKG